MDWSEQRPHLAGALGAAILARLLELGWLERASHGRALLVRERGARELPARLGVEGVEAPGQRGLGVSATVRAETTNAPAVRASAGA